MSNKSIDSQVSQELVQGPAYQIVTSRLLIRCWDPADAPTLSALVEANINHLRPWMPWAIIGTPLIERIQYLRNCRGEFDLGKDFIFGIFDKSGREVIGGTGLHTRRGTDVREIGYWISQEHVRKGYATEVSAALTKVAFEVDKVIRVEIHCAIDNQNSAGVPRKLGFVHEGNLRKRAPDADGRMLDSMIWTMLAEEYPNSIPSQMELDAYDAAGRRITMRDNVD